MIYNDTNNCEVRFPRNNSISGDTEMQWCMEDYELDECGEVAGNQEHLNHVGEEIECSHWNGGEYDTFGSYGLGDDDLEFLRVTDELGLRALPL